MDDDVFAKLTESMDQMEQLLARRKLAAILAGLRLLQRTRISTASDGWPEGIFDIATDGGSFPALSDLEIDAMCEEINQ